MIPLGWWYLNIHNIKINKSERSVCILKSQAAVGCSWSQMRSTKLKTPSIVFILILLYSKTVQQECLENSLHPATDCFALVWSAGAGFPCSLSSMLHHHLDSHHPSACLISKKFSAGHAENALPFCSPPLKPPSFPSSCQKKSEIPRVICSQRASHNGSKSHTLHSAQEFVVLWVFMST